MSQDKIQDMEKSLVERIADVDDERRRTSTQVRSALLTHREEVDARLSTFRHILLGMLALLLALTVAVVWLALDPRQGSDADPASPALAQQMSTLAERVDGIDGRVAGLDARSAAQAASQSARTDPAAGLSGEIDAMQQRMQTLEARIAALAKQVEDGAAGPTGAQAGQPDRSAAERLPVDRLIDVQLARLEQEYQRLAQKVASPAVASASSASDAELLPLAEDAEAEPRAASAAGAPATGTAAEGTAPADASDEPVVLDEPAIALQLIGFRSRDALAEFIAEHQLPEQLYIREGRYQGRPWYALIHSLHPSREAAEAARSTLPEDLADLDLWLRPLPAGTELLVTHQPGG